MRETVKTRRGKEREREFGKVRTADNQNKTKNFFLPTFFQTFTFSLTSLNKQNQIDTLDHIGIIAILVWFVCPVLERKREKRSEREREKRREVKRRKRVKEKVSGKVLWVVFVLWEDKRNGFENSKDTFGEVTQKESNNRVALFVKEGKEESKERERKKSQPHTS